MIDPDAELVRNAGAGDARAADALVRRHLPKMVGLARRMLNDGAEAEDVAQVSGREIIVAADGHAARGDEHRRHEDEQADRPEELGEPRVVGVDVVLAPQTGTWAVEGDAFLLRRALGNLMDNAIAFSPPGGTVLDVACGHGRHLRWFRALGHPVTGIDRDPLAVQAAAFGDEVIEADIENGPWPLAGRTFGVSPWAFRGLARQAMASE